MIANQDVSASVYAREMDNMDRRRRLGDNIRTKRIEANLTTRGFAQMASTSHTYLWQVESGTVSVGLDMLCRFADALGCEVRDLVDF